MDREERGGACAGVPTPPGTSLLPAGTVRKRNVTCHLRRGGDELSSVECCRILSGNLVYHEVSFSGVRWKRKSGVGKEGQWDWDELGQNSTEEE